VSHSVPIISRQAGARPPGGLKPFASRAFSLIEVVIAVAVFAGAIVAILGLLGPLMQNTREVLDSATAARLADSVDAELERLVRDPNFGFEWVEEQTSGEDFIELFGLQDGSYIVVADAAKNDPVTGKPRGILARDRYFRIVIRQLDAPASSDTFLALSIRAEWPYAVPAGENGVTTDETERQWFAFNTGLHR